MGSTEDSCGSSTPPEGEKQFGVTKPISMAGPGEIDHQRTSDLEKAGLYESEEEAAKRLEVLDEINQSGVNPLRRHSRAAPAGSHQFHPEQLISSKVDAANFARGHYTARML